jgi:DNA-binding NtrC family response regulator
MHNTHEITESPLALFLTPRGGASREVVALLERRGLQVRERTVDGNAFRFASISLPDLVLIEHVAPCEQSWQDLVADVRRACPSAPVILLTANGSEDVAVAALRLGVQDYLQLPLSVAALSQALERCLRNGRCGTGRLDPPTAAPADPMVGSSAELCKIKSYMSRAAASDCTVLITGETGTGKELAAEFIHGHSARRNKPFVCVNCAAIPDLLFESELFGHTRGAFTGADELSDGLLASADGGTVLLDEVGDMSLSAQAKILRVLEQKEVCRVGGTQRRKVDVRFVAATNQDLETMSNRGTFRKDLFYRLNVARIELPPLRERREDIPLLVDHYQRHLRGNTEISEECLHRLLQYDWPGNIRELKNVVESLFLVDAPNGIRFEHLPQRLRESFDRGGELLPDERERLVEALCSTHWNKSRAAEKLHWSRMTLYRKMAKYCISRFSSAKISPKLPL